MQCENCGKRVYANEKCSCGVKAPKKNNVGVSVNTVVCFALLMLVVFSFILTVSLRTVVNRNMVVESVEKLELANITVDDRKLDQYIYDEYVDDPRITVKNVDNLLEEDFIKDFIIEKVEAYQDYFLDKADMPYITSDEIVKLIDDNSEILYEEAGLRFLEPDKEELRRELSKLDSFKVDSNDFFNSRFGAAMSQTYFSYANAVFLVIMIAIIFIQWFIVYKLNERRISKMVYKFGLAVVIPSFIILAASIIGKIVNKLDAADKLMGSAVIPFMLYSTVFLALGVLVMVSGIIVNHNYKLANAADAGENTDSKTDDTDEVVEQSGEPEEEAPEDDVSPSDDEPRDESNVCPNCSFANRERAAFCCKCGTKLK